MDGRGAWASLRQSECGAAPRDNDFLRTRKRGRTTTRVLPVLSGEEMLRKVSRAMAVRRPVVPFGEGREVGNPKVEGPWLGEGGSGSPRCTSPVGG